MTVQTVCVLLVEDKWLSCSIVAKELTEGGFTACEAEDGDQASALTAQDPTVFSLLVTDTHMPGSLDSIKVARLMRACHPDIPVIYTTG